MPSSSELSKIELLRLSLPESDLRARLKSCSPSELEAIIYDWRQWARPNQLPPREFTAGLRSTWLILAGRGYGKTRTGAETVRDWHQQGYRFINLIARTSDELRRVMVEGESGILATCKPEERPRASKDRLVWPNGAVSLLFSAEEPDKLRGPQSDKIWCFIAGTQILTASGNVPIEGIKSGDLVMTRFGQRRVSGIGSRLADVGTVTFSDGAELVGTKEHPVCTIDGWTTLKHLSTGQSALKGTLSPTSARSRKTAINLPFISIDGLGKRRTARYPRACISTTSTRTEQTIPSRTFRWSHPSSIAPFTARSIAANHTRRQSDTNAAAVAVTRRSFSRAGRASRYARSAGGSLPKRSEPRCARASIAASNSYPGVELIAASVVSTWEPAGIQTVYNLTVEGAHEYIANGIVVHNCDEVAAWRYAEDAWDQAMFGLRLGDNPQAVVTTTPRPTKFIKKLMAEPATIITRGTTYENRSNLAPGFFSRIIKKYEGTRLGRQELQAEVLDDNPGALFTLEMIEGARVAKLPPLVRIVVALDPAVTSEEDSDEWGVVAAGVDGRYPPHVYVIADESEIYTPDEAAKVGVRLYHRLSADRMVAEANNGGDMIEALIRHQDANVSYKEVRASRGKVVRAEPVSALYEQGRVHHHGTLAKLEDQMTTFNARTGEKSPDRMDAMVWAITELAEGSGGWGGFVRSEGEAAIRQENPAALPRVNVSGGNHDKCDCGSVIWCNNGPTAKQTCFKCGKERPE